jgi:3'-5' exoribonuclease
MSLFDGQLKKFIEDLQVGQPVDTFYKVLAVDKRPRRDGTSFLTLELMDKTGKIPAKVWDNVETTFKMLKPGEVYRINGYVNEFKNKKEIKVDGIRPVSPADKDFDPGDFTEKPLFDTDALFREMMETIKSNLTNPHLVRLTDLFAAGYGDTFKTHYGAQKIHHAYIGGLLQHTYSMVKLAILIARHYSLDKELLLMGVLFHDVGKIFEFDITPAPGSTMEGGLIGHLVMSHSIFLELKKKIDGFPEELSCKIRHLIISHHGEKEFGSPEVPMIPEAFVLHILDLLDSRMKIMEDAVNNSETDGLFTDYIHPLGRRLFIDRDKGKGD